MSHSQGTAAWSEAAGPDPSMAYSRLWEEGPGPDLEAFLAGLGALTPEQLAGVLEIDLWQRWQRGRRLPAEHYLDAYPAVQADPECAVRLVYAEYLLRERQGEAPPAEEYARRFPALAERLKGQVALHRALAGTACRETAPAEGEATSFPLGVEPLTSPAGLWPQVPGYEVLGELGHGGMGVVYQARQLRLKRLVALKMLRPGPGIRLELLARFRAEAEAVARLQHPHIVQIFEVGEHQGLPYLALELVPGGSLAQRLRGTPLPTDPAARLVELLARAVQHAHEQGVIHRDLKPANILLQKAETPVSAVSSLIPHPSSLLPKIADFGLAKLLEEDSGQTQSGAILGTPSYMAPEQAEGRPSQITPTADVYALGAILYELLVGRPPFWGASPLGTLEQVRSQEPVPPSRLQPRLPRDLETICLKCLHKDPARRYASAAVLAEDLRRFQAHEPIHARRVSQVERLRRWGRRNPAVAVLAAAVFVSLLLGSAVSALLALRATENAARADREADAARHHADRADRQAKAAQENAVRADREAAAARNSENLLRQEKEVSDRRYYASEIRLASLDWVSGEMAAVRQRLRALEPRRAGELDQRGFEWYYLQRLCQLPLRTLRGHKGGVLAVAYSPDGRHIASADENGRLKIWNGATGQELLTLTGHTNGVTGLAYGPGGRRLASVSWDGTMRVWDASTGHQVFTVRCDTPELSRLKNGLSRFNGVAISRDGRQVAAGAEFGNARVWDAGTGQELLTLRGHSANVVSVAYSPDVRRLAAATGLELKVWDAATGKEIWAGRSVQWSHRVAYSPDGQQLVTVSEDGKVQVWDAATGHQVLTVRSYARGLLGVAQRPTSEFNGVAYSPDGRRIGAASKDGTVKLWDVGDGQEVLTLRGHAGPVWGLAFSPDGRRLASAGEDGTIKVWDATIGQEAISLNPGSRSVSDEGRPPFPKPALAYSRDGSRLACSVNPWVVRVWDTATSQETVVLHSQGNVFSTMAFSLDGRLLATALGGGDEVKVTVWDATTGKELRTFAAHNSVIRKVAFSPDNRRLASAHEDGSVKVWEVATGHEARSLPGIAGQVLDLSISPDGHLLAAAGWRGNVKVWEAATGREVLSLDRRMPGMRQLAFSPDSRRLASASEDGTVRVWDVATNRELLSLRGHGSGVLTVAYSPKGGQITSGSQDGMVKLWDATTGQELLTLRGSTSPVTSVAYSPDGMGLATACVDGSVRIWDARDMTPQLVVEREARSLLAFLYGKPLSREQVLQTIRQDQTIDEPLRQQALAWAEPYWQRLVQSKAEELAWNSFEGLRAEALERIRSDTTVSKEVRKRALTLVEHYQEDPKQINQSGWSTASRKDARAKEYAQALRYAEAACRLAPDNMDYLLALGVAQYRTRKYHDAADTLARPTRLRKEIAPEALAFLAMAHQRLDRRPEALAALQRLREAMKQPLERWRMVQCEGFLKEAEALIEGTRANPE
jgi:WD40 repeat protein